MVNYISTLTTRSPSNYIYAGCSTLITRCREKITQFGRWLEQRLAGDKFFFTKPTYTPVSTPMQPEERQALVAVAHSLIPDEMSDFRDIILAIVRNIPADERQEVVKAALSFITPEMKGLERVETLLTFRAIPAGERQAVVDAALSLITSEMDWDDCIKILKVVRDIPAGERQAVVDAALRFITPQLESGERIRILMTIRDIFRRIPSAQLLRYLPLRTSIAQVSLPLEAEGILYFFEDEIIYVGTWKDGKPHGQGIMYDPNGNTYAGEWKEDKLHGKIIVSYLVQGHHYFLEFDLNDLSYSSEQWRDLHFLKALVGQANYLDSCYAVAMLFKWLSNKPEYQEAADKLSSVNHIASLPSSAYEKEADVILTDLRNGRSRLLPFGYYRHAMGLNLIPREKVFIDCEFFNSGDGLCFHPCHPKSQKYQTMIRVRVPIAEMTREILQQILSYQSLPSFGAAYALISQIPGATLVDVPESLQVWQTKQKSENCSIEWMFAYLKYSLGETAYREMRRELFTDCLAELERAFDPRLLQGELKKVVEGLKNELRRKITKRRPL